MDARRLEKFQEQLYRKSALLGWWRRRRAILALAASGAPGAYRLLAWALTNHEIPSARRLIASILSRVRQPKLVDVLASVWEETRHPSLTSLLRENRWVATFPPELRAATALKNGQEKAVLDGQIEMIEPVFRACEDSDPEISRRAFNWLDGLTRPTEIETFCDLVARADSPELRKLALDRGYQPRDAAKRALYFFLTGQMERYEALDFDHRLLRSNYEAADDEIRQLIAARVRSSGRSELAVVIQGGLNKRQLSQMTSGEWETIITLLRSNKRHADLWNLVFEAPPEWSSEILGLLKLAGFRPASETDRGIFERLLKLRPVEGKNLRLFWPVPLCQLVLRKHQHGIKSIAFSSDGRSLATVSSDTTSLLWDATVGRLKTSLTKKVGLALAMQFSPDARQLAVANVDNCARIWDLASWQEKAAFPGHADKISALGFAPDGSLLATGSYDNTLRIWHSTTGRCQAVARGHKSAILTLAFSPDGKLIATGSHDETVRLWFALSGEAKTTLTGILGSVCALDFSPDGRTLAAACSDGTVRLWNVSSGELKASFPAHKDSVMSIAYSPDGSRLATAGLDRAVRLWDVLRYEVKAALQGHSDEATAVAFSPDGKMLATGARDKTVRLWQIASTKPLMSMTREDLQQIQLCVDVLPSPELAKPWHFVTTLARHRFRYDIEITESAEKLFTEFDIEIEDLQRT